jgi:hypothetical protein
MYAQENYYDEEMLLEDLSNEELVYESYDEALPPNNLRPIKGLGIRPGIVQKSNFATGLHGRSNEYVSKIELKRSLDKISQDVNDLKKSTIDTGKALASLDKKHIESTILDAKKNDKQTADIQNMQMMNMIGALLNQPKFRPENLEITNETTGTGTNVVTKQVIKEKANESALEIDNMLSILPLLMTTQGGSGDMNKMMFPLVLLMTQKDKNNKKDDNNMMLFVVMMMMGQGKK